MASITFDELQKANTASPPQYDQQGVLVAGTGGKPVSNSKPISNDQTGAGETTDQSTHDTRINELTKLLFTPPATTQSLYEGAYKTSGLSEIKTKLSNLDQRIASIKQSYLDTGDKINENPWLSEASRVGRASRLSDKAQAEIGNLVDQYNQYANLYTQGLNEVNATVGRQSTDSQNTQNVYQTELNYLLGLKDKQEQRTYDFAKANNILFPFYKYPGNSQVYDARTGEPVNYDEYKKRGGLGIPNGSWPDVQEIGLQDAQKLISVSEGNSLYDPNTGEVVYTAPKQYKPTSGGGGGGSSSGDSKPISSSIQSKYYMPSSIAQDEFDQVRNQIISIKNSSSDWTDAWGKVADWLQQNGIEAKEYDALLWDLLHPEGLAGYKKYILGQGTSTGRSL